VQKGLIVALASAVLFGHSTPVAKMLVGSTDPLVLAGLLYAGSGVGLLLVFTARRLLKPRNSAASLPHGREWLWLAGAIFFGGITAPAALTYGLVTSTASSASLLLNLEAVFTVLLAWFLFHENFDRRVAVGMSLIVGGGVLLAFVPMKQSDAPLGLMLIVIACLCWAVDNNLTRRIAANDAVMIAGVKGLVAGAINLGLSVVIGRTFPPARETIVAMSVGFLGYGISLVLFVLALRHLGAARAAAYFATAPFVGALVAVLLQNEPITVQLVLAGALMAAGVVVHLAEQHRHLHAHESLEHSHTHSHDEHHDHAHAFAWDGREPHSHPHLHLPIVHAHVHYPDVHHRHPH
jgi:drug/metabolite transporter (DMT)-like permease